MPPERTRVASCAEFPDRSMQPVDVDGVEVLIARIGDEFFALDNLCSHAESWLDTGRLLPDSCEVECPLHEGRFDLRTGAPTHPPADSPVRSWDVCVEDGEVFVLARN